MQHKKIEMDWVENMKKIETERLILRNFEESDYEDLFEFLAQRKEAITAVLKEAFKTGTHRVFAECDPRNKCSWRLLESLSFQREAFFKQNVYFKKDENGKPVWQDTYVYSYVYLEETN